MTRRELLLAICETPGWTPPDPAPSSVGVHLRALIGEGWVVPRLDGYEGSPQALDAYPAFVGHGELADPAASVTPLPAPAPAPDGVALARVECLLAALLCELPLGTVLRMTSTTPQNLSPDTTLWAIARQAARRMVGEGG